MLQAREAFSRRSWSHPLEYVGEEWWADVLADPRARRQTRGSHSRGALNIYRLRDEPRSIIMVACTKCDWKASYSRDELIALHGADCPLPNLLDHIAAPGCHRLGSNWGPLRRALRRADQPPMLSLSAEPDTPRPHPSTNHDAMSGWADTVNSNVAPRGTFTLAHRRPLCASIIDRQIDSPIPIPPDFVV
jgi:hypothetical protein